MKFIIISVALVLNSAFSFSQQSSQILKVNSGDQNGHIKGYFYETFLDGKAISVDGTFAKAKLNFNRITNEMLFISPQGDTLKMANPVKTPLIVIATDSFYYTGSTFLTKITHFDNGINLFQEQKMRRIYEERKSAYGYSPVTSDIPLTTYNISDGISRTAKGDINVVFKNEGAIYFVDKKGNYIAATQNNFEKEFKTHKSSIKHFIESEKIDFKKSSDIIQLTEYINNLIKAPF